MPSRRWSALALPIVLALCGLVSCSRPGPTAPPRDLDRALGTPRVALTPEATDPGEPLETLVVDLMPLIQAGFADAGVAIPAVIRDLIGVWEPGHALFLEGTHLVVRHTPGHIGLLKTFLERLFEEKLRPIDLDLVLLDVPAPVAEARAALAEAPRERLADPTTRVIVQQHLTLTNGVWRTARLARHARLVSRIDDDGGVPVPIQDTIADGPTVTAAAWLSPDGAYAVLHLEAALQTTRPDPRTPRLATSWHPAREDRSIEVEAALDLIALDTVGVRGEPILEPGAWTLVATAPAHEDGRAVVALARATWDRPDPGDAPLLHLPDGRAVRTIRVALPEDAAPTARGTERAKGFVWGRPEPGADGATAFDLEAVRNAYREEAARQTIVQDQVQNDWDLLSGGSGLSLTISRYDPFVASIPAASGSRMRGAGPRAWSSTAWRPLLPERLETRLVELLRADWGPGARVLRLWDQLVCVQSDAVSARTARLVGEIQSWRNAPVLVVAEWVEVPAALADALRGTESLAPHLDALRKGRLLPALTLAARSGAWSEVSTARARSALSSSMGPDRATPALRLAQEGVRLSVLPRRYGHGRLELDVRFSQSRVAADSLVPVRSAGGWIARPDETTSIAEHVIAVRPGEPALLFGSSPPDPASGSTRALLVTAWP